MFGNKECDNVAGISQIAFRFEETIECRRSFIAGREDELITGLNRKDITAVIFRPEIAADIPTTPPPCKRGLIADHLATMSKQRLSRIVRKDAPSEYAGHITYERPTVTAEAIGIAHKGRRCTLL